MLLKRLTPLALVLPALALVAACSASIDEKTRSSGSSVSSEPLPSWVDACGLLPVPVDPNVSFDFRPEDPKSDWPDTRIEVVNISSDPSNDPLDYVLVDIFTNVVKARFSVAAALQGTFENEYQSAHCSDGGQGHAPIGPPPPPPDPKVYPQGCVSQDVIDYADACYCPPAIPRGPRSGGGPIHTTQ